MAAIALAESGGDSGIVNSIGASGLWQIHPPEPGVLDPLTNARIAVRKHRTQGLGAWEAYTNGSYRQFLGQSGRAGSDATVATSGAAAPVRRAPVPLTARLGGVLSSRPKGMGGRVPADRAGGFFPTISREQIAVLSGDPKTNPKSRTARLFQLGVRRNKIIGDLTSGKVKRPEKQQDLLNELQGIDSEIADLQGPDTSATGTAKIPGADAFFGRADRDQALAALTPDTEDDKQVATRIAQGWKDVLAYEQAHPDQFTDADIADAARNVKSSQDALDGLTSAVQDNTQAILDLTQQQRDDAQRALAVSQSQYGILANAITQVVSGQIGGRLGLGFQTPSFAGGVARP